MTRSQLAFGLAFVAACQISLGQAPPNTGAGSLPLGATDPNYSISTASGGTTSAVVVSKPGAQPGSQWIGPDPAKPFPGFDYNVVYSLKFKVTGAAKAVITMNLNSDPDVDVSLNGNFIVNHATTFTSTTLTGLKEGDNMLLFLVSDFGVAKTSYLNVAFVDANQPPPPPATVQNSAPSDSGTDAAPDPVDSATGQFYSTEQDFQLGGPARLGFGRYYSSQLSLAGVSSALKTNWMGTYDTFVLIKSSSAQVILFGGRVVNFTNTAGAWQLISPISPSYQFSTVTGGSYQFLDPRARLRYTYSSAGALTRIEDRNGNAITVTAGTGGPSQVADGLGRTLAFTYSNGQLTSVKDQTGRTMSYAYTGGLLTSVTNPLKGITQYAYTSAGTKTALLTKRTLPLGNAPATQTYDAKGRVITQTDPDNNVLRLSYDDLGGTAIADPLANLTQQRSDPSGNLIKLTDATGATANLTYDSSSRPATVTDRLGNTVGVVYHPQTGYVAASTDWLGNTTSFDYTAQTQGPFTFYNLTAVAFPDGGKAAVNYDANGNLTSLTRPDGSTRQFTYDSKGQLTAFKDPLGQSTTYTWNPDGTLASLKDALGNITAYEYDTVKRLVRITDPNAKVANFKYDDAGHLISSSAPGGQPVTQHFDANGQLDSFTGPSGEQYSFAYTRTGQLASITDPLGTTTTNTYDAAGHRLKLQNSSGESQLLTYDPLGRVLSVADNSGVQAIYTYDAEGNIASSKDGAGNTTLHTYDSMGRETALTTPGGNTYSQTFDARGNILTRTNPLGEQFLNVRDALGRLVKTTSPGDVSTTLQRDANGNIVGLTSPNGNTWSFSYDTLQRIKRQTDPLGNAASYSYTGSRLSKIDYPLGSLTLTSSPTGNITRLQYSDGTVINKTYDASGLLLTADGVTIKRNKLGQQTSVNGMDATLDSMGRPLTLAYAPGKVLTYSYDASGRVASVTDWTGASITLAYDDASRRASMTYPNGVTTSFGYDGDGHLTNLSYGPLGSIALTRDAAGKILSADRNLPLAPALKDNTEVFGYNASSQVDAATYDTMGRVTSQGSRSYSWNLASRLVAFADPVDNARLTYDGLGEVSSATTSGTTQTFITNHAMKYPALSIARTAGTDTAYYVYLPQGELLCSIDPATDAHRFYHFDEMGNTAFLTGDSGAITDSYAITPYGEIADHIGTTDNPFTWQAQYGAIQEGLRLYYLRNRHYDAATARFLSPDPIISASPLSTEPYGYARSNPVLFQDPQGTSVELHVNLEALKKQRKTMKFDLNDPEYIALSVAIAIVKVEPEINFWVLASLSNAIADAFIAYENDPSNVQSIAEQFSLAALPDIQYLVAAPSGFSALSDSGNSVIQLKDALSSLPFLPNLHPLLHSLKNAVLFDGLAAALYQFGNLKH